jgi:hypothetical protein
MHCSSDLSQRGSIFANSLSVSRSKMKSICDFIVQTLTCPHFPLSFSVIEQMTPEILKYFLCIWFSLQIADFHVCVAFDIVVYIYARNVSYMMFYHTAS